MLDAFSEVLRKHGLGTCLSKAHCESVPGTVPGDCYTNVELLVSLYPSRFEGVFGYMVVLRAGGRAPDSPFDIELRPHAVVRMRPNGRPLEVSTGTPRAVTRSSSRIRGSALRCTRTAGERQAPPRAAARRLLAPVARQVRHRTILWTRPRRRRRPERTL